jgi:pimeloyl-ACP methyl ester carboxylesterase
MAEVVSGDVSVGGVRSPFIQSGDSSSAEAVVFVHGNPGSSEDWRELLGLVGEFTRGVALDMPGYGKADRPRDFDYSPEGYGRHLGDALGQLGIERVHLVVHEFGGMWSWAWLDSNPSRLASLVVFNTGLLANRRWHSVARRWRTPVIGELMMAAVTRSLFHRGLAQRARPLPPGFIDRMYDDFDRGTRRAVLKLYRKCDLPYPASDRWMARLKELEPPALIVWGLKDPYAGPNRIEEFKRVLPQAEVTILEDSGHWPFADDPERAVAAVIPFLRRQVA